MRRASTLRCAALSASILAPGFESPVVRSKSVSRDRGSARSPKLGNSISGRSTTSTAGTWLHTLSRRIEASSRRRFDPARAQSRHTCGPRGVIERPLRRSPSSSKATFQRGMLTEASYTQNERNQKDLRLDCDLLRPDPDPVRSLRHELRPHARAALGDRITLSHCLTAMVLLSVGLYLNVQTAQVAVKAKARPGKRRLDHLKVSTRRRLSDHLSHAPPQAMRSLPLSHVPWAFAGSPYPWARAQKRRESR